MYPSSNLPEQPKLPEDSHIPPSFPTEVTAILHCHYSDCFFVTSFNMASLFPYNFFLVSLSCQVNFDFGTVQEIL